MFACKQALPTCHVAERTFFLISAAIRISPVIKKATVLPGSGMIKNARGRSKIIIASHTIKHTTQPANIRGAKLRLARPMKPMTNMGQSANHIENMVDNITLVKSVTRCSYILNNRLRLWFSLTGLAKNRAE